MILMRLIAMLIVTGVLSFTVSLVAHTHPRVTYEVMK